MRETKIYCDHCGKVLDCMKDYDDIVIEIGANYVETDLCAECLSELYEMTKTFCSDIYKNKLEDIKNKLEDIK